MGGGGIEGLKTKGRLRNFSKGMGEGGGSLIEMRFFYVLVGIWLERGIVIFKEKRGGERKVNVVWKSILCSWFDRRFLLGRERERMRIRKIVDPFRFDYSIRDFYFLKKYMKKMW